MENVNVSWFKKTLDRIVKIIADLNCMIQVNLRSEK